MPSANKDRIRVTLHVDRKIYALVKMWSDIDQKPISRLFDEVFLPHVKRFEKYGSFFDYKYDEKQDEDYNPDEEFAEIQRIEEERKKEKERMSKMSEEEKDRYHKKFIEFLEQEESRKEKEEEEYNKRWEKAYSKMRKSLK